MYLRFCVHDVSTQPVFWLWDKAYLNGGAIVRCLSHAAILIGELGSLSLAFANRSSRSLLGARGRSSLRGFSRGLLGIVGSGSLFSCFLLSSVLLKGFNSGGTLGTDTSFDPSGLTGSEGGGGMVLGLALLLQFLDTLFDGAWSAPWAELGNVKPVG